MNATSQSKTGLIHEIDRHSAAEVLELLEKLVHDFGKTVIMVTHDPRAAEKAHVVRQLEKGVLM